MKSPEEIRKELHEYIDRIEDDDTLWQLHEEVMEYVKESSSEETVEEEIAEIKIGLQQIEDGETVDWDEYVKATSRWRTK